MPPVGRFQKERISENQSMKTKFLFRVLALLSIGIGFSDGLTNQVIAKQTDDFNGTAFEIHSHILGETRILHISVPDNYGNSQNSYPVLYQLDGGEKSFSEAVHDIRELSSRDEIPEMIVVGIENSDRWRDMLPVRVETHPTSGGAHKFLEFIDHEVARFVEENYRADDVRILFGRSNSALFAIFAITENTDVCKGYIASSPSLGHCEDYIIDRTVSFLNSYSGPERFLFVSNGGLDEATRLVSPIPGFVDTITDNSTERFTVRYVYYENEGHCPSPTLKDGLISFFNYLNPVEIGYFDQRPPGLTPKRFAPGTVSTAHYSETGCTFTPDEKEFYFTRSGGGLRSPVIFFSRLLETKWTEPEKAPFSGFGPHISPNGEMLFVSKHGYDKESQRTVGLWFANKKENGWTDLQYHGPGNRASMSSSFNLYYLDRSDPEDKGVIVVQEFADGKYLEPEVVGGGVNSPHYEAHPCIARDESFIVFDSNRPGGYGEGDLYICFRCDDGTWGDAVNLGPAINTEGYEAYSSISPDGEHIFYSSNNTGNYDLYWVDLKIIENARGN